MLFSCIKSNTFWVCFVKWWYQKFNQNVNLNEHIILYGCHPPLRKLPSQEKIIFQHFATLAALANIARIILTIYLVLFIRTFPLSLEVNTKTRPRLKFNLLRTLNYFGNKNYRIWSIPLSTKGHKRKLKHIAFTR